MQAIGIHFVLRELSLRNILKYTVRSRCDS